MPRPARPWFRFYVEALHDRKLRRLTPAQRWLWVAVLGAARSSCVPGFLLVSERQPMDAGDLADLAGMAVRDVTKALPLFEASEMIEMDADLGCWFVTHFHERQFESDDVTERTRKHRSKERGRNVPTNDVGTLVGTPPETETETETETDSSITSPSNLQEVFDTAAGMVLKHREQTGWGPAGNGARTKALTELAEYAPTVTRWLEHGTHPYRIEQALVARICDGPTAKAPPGERWTEEP